MKNNDIYLLVGCGCMSMGNAAGFVIGLFLIAGSIYVEVQKDKI